MKGILVWNNYDMQKKRYIVRKLKNIGKLFLYITWLKWDFVLVCLNVGWSRFIDVTFSICGTRIHIWCILYALVWCVGGLVGIHLDMALLWIQSTYDPRKQRPLGEIYFSGFVFSLHFNITHSNFPCCKLLEQFLVVIAWNYKFCFGWSLWLLHWWVP